MTDIEDIIGPEDQKETWHITIEGSEDGRILEADVESFVIVYGSAEEVHMRDRGWNSTFETYGVLTWMTNHAEVLLHSGDTDADPLVDRQ